MYLEAQGKLKESLKELEEDKEDLLDRQKHYDQSLKLVRKQFPKDTINAALLETYHGKDTILIKAVEEVQYWLGKTQLVNDPFKNSRNWIENANKYAYNLDYDDRILIGDNVHDINDRHYGNSYTKPHPEDLWYGDHGTKVASIIAADRTNSIGVAGGAEKRLLCLFA